MKKILIFTAILLTLVSCKKQETKEPQHEIKISVQSNPGAYNFKLTVNGRIMDDTHNVDSKTRIEKTYKCGIGSNIELSVSHTSKPGENGNPNLAWASISDTGNPSSGIGGWANDTTLYFVVKK